MKTPAFKARRKPQQSRARMTQGALLESFVRLLDTQDYPDITIRDITELAGVGLGTFYEYFGDKDELAALCIHQYIKQQARALEQYANTLEASLELALYIEALVNFQIQSIRQEQHIWATLFLLERQISSVSAYQKHYRLHVESWCKVLVHLCNCPRQELESLALNLHRIIYSMISQTLLQEPEYQHWFELKQDIRRAISGFLPLSP